MAICNPAPSHMKPLAKSPPHSSSARPARSACMQQSNTAAAMERVEKLRQTIVIASKSQKQPCLHVDPCPAKLYGGFIETRTPRYQTFPRCRATPITQRSLRMERYWVRSGSTPRRKYPISSSAAISNAPATVSNRARLATCRHPSRNITPVSPKSSNGIK